MPKINHHDDTMLTYLNKSHIKETLGWNSIEYRRKADVLSDMRARKIDVCMENIDTTVLKKYNTLSDAPREPADTFAARYAIESRNHHYLSSNPITIESWTADIARKSLQLSDSSERSVSTSSYSSSSTSLREPQSSPSILLRSPPHRRQSLYSATRKSNSHVLNETSSSSSATSSSSAPTLSNNNNIPEQVGENNVDLAIFSRSRDNDTSTRFSIPTKKRKINSLIAQHVRLLSVTQQSSLKILDSGAGISGVGQQWQMKDLSQASEVTIQGAFCEPMKPTVQGLLGPDMLQAVLVPGIKDDIYSLCQLLQPNHRTGTTAKIAIFTENEAIVMTSESCQSLIKEATQQGSQTHVADQIGGIYVLRNLTTTLATMSAPH